VLVVAVLFGRGAAIAASVLAFLTFDWFFVPPTHQLVVADPGELFALALFLFDRDRDRDTGGA
jgi:two-component system sensor histidine kinase KdpD